MHSYIYIYIYIHIYARIMCISIYALFCEVKWPRYSFVFVFICDHLLVYLHMYVCPYVHLIRIIMITLRMIAYARVFVCMFVCSFDRLLS